MIRCGGTLNQSESYAEVHGDVCGGVRGGAWRSITVYPWLPLVAPSNH